MHRVVAMAIVCGVAIAPSIGCGESSEGGPRPGPEGSAEFIRDAVEQANEMLDFPMLWLGRSYRGYRVNEIHPEGPVAGVDYGDCEIPSEQQEGGCPRPYQLQQQDACADFPVAGDAHPRRRPDGTIAYSEGGGLVVITGRTYVKIFGKNARVAAQQLRPLGHDGPSSGLKPSAGCVSNIAR